MCLTHDFRAINEGIIAENATEC